MASITKTREEILDLLEDADLLDEEGGKYDVTHKRYLFEIDGKHYAAWLGFSYTWGLEDSTEFTLHEVEEVPIVKTEWRKVQ